MPFASCANSTFFMLHHIVNSYQLTGDITVAELDGIHLRKLPVPVFKQTARLTKAFKTLSSRPIKSIFAELGLPKPERDFSNIDPKKIKLDKVMPDRAELDDAVLEALGFEGERDRKKVLLELYQGVVVLVKDRLMRARCFEETEDEDHDGV